MIRKAVVLVVLVIVSSTAGWVAYAQGGQTVSNSQKWEYRTDLIPVPNEIWPNLEPTYRDKLLRENGNAFEKLLNQRGAEGWELAGIGSSFFYFKRQK